MSRSIHISVIFVLICFLFLSNCFCEEISVNVNVHVPRKPIHKLNHINTEQNAKTAEPDSMFEVDSIPGVDPASTALRARSIVPPRIPTIPITPAPRFRAIRTAPPTPPSTPATPPPRVSSSGFLRNLRLPRLPRFPSFNEAIIDPATKTALQKFRSGAQGASVKGLSSLIEGKSIAEINTLMEGMQNKGWKKIDGHGTNPATGATFPQTFWINNDGGVLRVKPQGMPGAKQPSLLEPHAAVYVMKDPKLKPEQGGLEFANEAFKVAGSTAVPKFPKEMKTPDGIKVENGNPQFEAWLKETGWAQSTHIHVAK